MRHFGTVTYYDAQKKFAYINENGTDYAVTTSVVQFLPEPDQLLKKGNTVYFSVVQNKVPGKRNYAQNITRVVESFNPRVKRTEGEKKLLEIFRASSWLSGWTVLEQPYINGLHPDFVLIHPFKGVVIVEVKDWNLNDSTRYRDGQVLGSDGTYRDADPAYQLNRYASCLSGLTFLEPEGLRDHIWNTSMSIYHLEDNPSNRNMVLDRYSFFEKVVFFSRPDITLEQARKFCPNSQFVWTRNEAEYLLDRVHNRFSECQEFPWALRLFGYGKVQVATKYCSDAPITPDGTNLFIQYLRRLTCWLDGTDYERARKKPYQLTQAQQALAQHVSRACRACESVISSGKSLILAQKAADGISAQRRVLVLSYNITLTNYLRDLCRQQFTGDSRAFNQWLRVDYFHGILRDTLYDLKLTVKMEEGQGADVNAEEKNRVIRTYVQKSIEAICQSSAKADLYGYDDVLIDEGNDFCDFEIAFLKSMVYNGTGEFLVMHDTAHRIYSNLSLAGLWADDPATLGLTKCALPYTYCLPHSVKDLLERTQKAFQIPGLAMEIEPSAAELTSYGSARWFDQDPTHYQKGLLNELSYWLKERQVHPEDLIMVTVDYQSAKRLSETLRNAGIPVQLCESLRNSKQEFWAGKNNVKVATYHNFKGWHAPYVILVLDSDLAPQEELQHSAVLSAFYVALSRVKPTSDTRSYCFRCLNFLSDSRLRPLAALFEQ